MSFNIFKWCDEYLTHLKEAGIQIDNGVAVLPHDSIFTKQVKMVSTFKYRTDIPADIQKESVLCNYMPDSDLFVRLEKIEADAQLMKEYGGVCGQDLSPSVGMLRPRQRFSILINSIYNCELAMRGIKILPNSRVGDLGTTSMVNSFPNGVSFIAGMHGCKKYGFKKYGLYQLRLTIKEKQPPVLYVYGTLTVKEAQRLFWCNDFKIITFPDRRNRVRNDSKSYVLYFDGSGIQKVPYSDYLMGGAA